MRILVALLAISVFPTQPADSQEPRQAGFVRGIVVSNEPGDLVVQSAPELCYHYRTDGRTWIEREYARIRVTDLTPGETLEVVSDREPQLIRYARLVHVISRVVTRPVNVSAGMYRLPRGAMPDRPLLTYSGFVSGREGQRFTIRTRLDGEITMYLREDARLLEGGQETNLSALRVNMAVSVRVVRNPDNVMEAFEIVCGQKLQPSQSPGN